MNRLTPSTIDLARKAVECSACFDDPKLGLTRAGIGMAQPFTIGVRYESACPRVVLISINPGAAKDGAYKERRRVHLERFLAGDDNALSDYFGVAESDARSVWANSSFVQRVEALGLDFESIAFGNIALCAAVNASGKNDYPSEMLERCFDRHSFHQLRNLPQPDVVILMGTPAHKFQKKIKEIAPRVFPCITSAFARTDAIGVLPKSERRVN